MANNSLQYQYDICKDLVEGIEIFKFENYEAIKKLELIIDESQSYEDLQKYYPIFLMHFNLFKDKVLQSIEILESHQDVYSECANGIITVVEVIGQNSIKNNDYIVDGLVLQSSKLFNKRNVL